MPDTNRKMSRGLYRCIMIICAAVILAGGVFLLYHAWQNGRDRALDVELRDMYGSADPFGLLFGTALAEEAPAAPVEETEVITRPEEEVVPEFKALWDRNPDIVGWMTFGGDMSYPVVWRDNEYYLDHNFDGRSSSSGTIFLDVLDHPDMSDDNLVIYGHNMRNGSMFGDLDKFRKLSFTKKNPIITLHNAWEEQPREYVIFAMMDVSVYTGDVRYFRVRHVDFQLMQEAQAFLDEVLARSVMQLPVDVSAEDTFLTLVTCSYSYDNDRFLLFARRLREGESADDLRAAFAALG